MILSMIAVRNPVSGLVKILTSIVVLAICTLFSSYGQSNEILQEDIQLWLEENLADTTGTHNNLYYVSLVEPTYQNQYTVVTAPHTYIYDHEFKESQERIAKAKEEKLLRQLSEQLKVKLFTHRDKFSNHTIYVNTLKRELVGKSQIGRAKYEIRVSKKQAELNLRYTFK